jgi:hypothetical protein
MPITCSHRGLSLEELAHLAAHGELKVHVDATLPLAEAHRHVEERRNRGKVRRRGPNTPRRLTPRRGYSLASG